MTAAELKTIPRLDRWLVALTTLALLAGCHAQAPEDTSIKVTNGELIGEGTYPAVVNIIVGNAACTATFVSDTTLITAGHCVDEPGSRVYVRKYNAYSDRIYVHPQWQGARINHDLAVVTFPAGTSPHSRPLAATSPAVGSDITIVGYGKFNHFDDRSAGRKRVGRNTLRSKYQGILQFHGATGPGANGVGSGVNSASSSGDSGGPLFVEEKMAGITSSGDVRFGDKHSFYVDLNYATNRQFLEAAVNAGADIPSLADEPEPDDTQDPDPAPTVPGDDDQGPTLDELPRQLYAALGEQKLGSLGLANSYRLFVAGQEDVTQIRVCTATGLSLCPDGTEGLNVISSATLNLGGKPVFVDDRGVDAQAGKTLAIVGLDKDDQIISAQAFSFESAN